jgi:hypothetical protein
VRSATRTAPARFIASLKTLTGYTAVVAGERTEERP